ncbi:hypothetical protein HJA86_30890 [Rhizobium bangladeshense]|nr:hypothetical protein [Rhizobium bangladeshense]
MFEIEAERPVAADAFVKLFQKRARIIADRPVSPHVDLVLRAWLEDMFRRPGIVSLVVDRIGLTVLVQV